MYLTNTTSMISGSERSEIVAVELLDESPVDSGKNESEIHLKVQALQYQVW